jgi:hypothetical protein
MYFLSKNVVHANYQQESKQVSKHFFEFFVANLAIKPDYRYFRFLNIQSYKIKHI